MADEKSKNGGPEPSDFARGAMRNLRRAKKTFEGNGAKRTAECDYYLQEAQVMAIMDLAQAVRVSPKL